MNVENMQKLLAWLKDGAPHSEFNMNVGLEFQPKRYKGYESVPAKCGTACCLAGASYMLEGGITSSIQELISEEEDEFELPWMIVFSHACKWLGLSDTEGSEFFNPFARLYDGVENAYEAITLDMAIEAVERKLEGKKPWGHLENIPEFTEYFKKMC